MYSQALDLFGAIINTTSFLLINGTYASKCVFYIKTENVTFTYDANATQQLLSSGQTMDQIQQAEQNSTEQASAYGYDDRCMFATGDLTAMLTNWQNGIVSSDDYNKAKCSGKVFGSGNVSGTTGNAQSCAQNSDCGPNGLCNLADDECLQRVN